MDYTNCRQFISFAARTICFFFKYCCVMSLTLRNTNVFINLLKDYNESVRRHIFLHYRHTIFLMVSCYSSAWLKIKLACPLDYELYIYIYIYIYIYQTNLYMSVINCHLYVIVFICPLSTISFCAANSRKGKTCRD